MVNNAGSGASLVTGAVTAWTDKLATVTQNITPLTAPVYDTVSYTFDPTLASGTLENEPGFILPQSKDLTYVG